MIREAGGDHDAVTGGTRLLSDWLLVRVSADPGEGFLDRMISLIEGAKRQKTPNEIALNILLAGFTIVFLVVCATLLPYSIYSVNAAGQGAPLTITVLVALLVCLIPTTIGGLLSAIGIAGMDRMIRRNVVATSGRAVEAAGDVDVLLLDKTGTITLGNRQAVGFHPGSGGPLRGRAGGSRGAGLAGRRHAGGAQHRGAGEGEVRAARRTLGARAGRPQLPRFIPFSAQTRMSGVDVSADGRPAVSIRKGVLEHDPVPGSRRPAARRRRTCGRRWTPSRTGGTPLVVVRRPDGAPGVVHLKDIVKGGMKERFEQLRRMGIKTVMITGDNPRRPWPSRRGRRR